MLRLPRARREEREVDARAEDVLGFFGAAPARATASTSPPTSLSYANRRRLEIARAMATGARLLLLDEPAAGMNPNETHEITELIGRLRDERGYTILVIEHDMHVVEGISDRVVALDHGEKLDRGHASTRSPTTPAVDRGLPRPQPRGAAEVSRAPIANGSPLLAARRRHHLLRADADPRGDLAAGRRRRARLPARRQRLGQVDDAEDDPRHRAPAQRPRAARRRGRQRPGRSRSGSPAAWRSCPRTGACSGS